MSHKLSVITIICASLMLNAVETMARTVDPDFSQSKGLICYQCKSVSSDRSPLCDSSIFKSATLEEKKNMTFHCPRDRDSYCFKKVNMLGSKKRETIRGCSGSMDAVNNTLKVGCVISRTITYCLCDEDLCNNRTSRPFQNFSILRIFIPIIILLHLLLSNNTLFLL